MFAKATAAAESVIRQGTYLAEAHTTLACVKAFYLHDWRGAETAFKQAIELDPSGAMSWQWYGMCHLALGKLNEGLDKRRRVAASRDEDVGRRSIVPFLLRPMP
jgi:hypothetical protein